MAVCCGLWQFAAVCGSLLQYVAVCGSLWQLYFLQIDNHYRPERRRREGRLRTPHDPILAFSRIFGIPRNS